MTDYSGNGHPAFFAQAPVLRVRDPLAEFLGAAQQGILEYRYEDAVRLAGHSCPTVAGAYLMVLAGLAALYDDGSLPERGGIWVYMAGARDEGTVGVTASVATLLTGAATEMGFGGIGPQSRFARRNLLVFGQPLSGSVMALQRADNGQGVRLRLEAEHRRPAEIRSLMPKAVSGSATPEELRRFADLWQEQVRLLLAGGIGQAEVLPWRPDGAAGQAG